MDAEPSTSAAKSTNVYSPPRKREKVSYLSSAEKQTAINAYKQLVTDTPPHDKRNFKTVYRVINEYKKTGKTSGPEKITSRHSVLESFDEAVKTAVRQIVHNMFRQNELPTLDKVLAQINNSRELPNMSRSTLYRLMKQLNFKYLKRDRNSVLTERDDIVRWRRQYLKDISLYRSKNRPIFYLDETWSNEGHIVQKIWMDTSVLTHRQAFVEGFTTGLKNPSGKGRRQIILHIGSSDGFIENGLLLFEGKKISDYHEEIKATVFEDWFSNILPYLPEKAVVVTDNSPYHSRKAEKTPTTLWRKADIQNWLRNKGIEYEEDMVRAELLNSVNMVKSKYNSYVIDEIAKSKNKTVLRLPPYHGELNSIELVWAQIKNEVTAKNRNFKLNEVKQLLHNAINNVTAATWQKCINNVIKEEARMKDIIAEVMEPLIIYLGDDSGSDDSISSPTSD